VEKRNYNLVRFAQGTASDRICCPYGNIFFCSDRTVGVHQFPVLRGSGIYFQWGRQLLREANRSSSSSAKIKNTLINVLWKRKN
jgi:hypothetical protein